MSTANLVLLPGLMCDERLWQPQVDALQVHAIVADTTLHDNFADMAHHLLDSAPASFALAGLSMGGILAFEIWRQAPERVTHMALIDTNPYADTEQKRQTRLEQIQVAMQGGLREMAIESLKPMYLAEVNRDNDEILNTVLDMALDLGPDVFNRQSVALRERCDSVATLDTIDCPTAVICGEEDRLCPVELHELMAERIPNAKLTVAKNCGHLATLEQPQVVNEALASLLVN